MILFGHRVCFYFLLLLIKLPRRLLFFTWVWKHRSSGRSLWGRLDVPLVRRLPLPPLMALFNSNAMLFLLPNTEARIQLYINGYSLCFHFHHLYLYFLWIFLYYFIKLENYTDNLLLFWEYWILLPCIFRNYKNSIFTFCYYCCVPFKFLHINSY